MGGGLVATASRIHPPPPLITDHGERCNQVSIDNYSDVMMEPASTVCSLSGFRRSELSTFIGRSSVTSATGTSHRLKRRSDFVHVPGVDRVCKIGSRFDQVINGFNELLIL